MELVEIEKKNLELVFSPNGCDDIIDRIRKEVSGHEPDLSTVGGRKEIASLAYKVRQSKTVIDKAGMGFVADIKAKVKVVDVERKRVRDELDRLAEDVRRPLTEWEEAEELRREQERERQVMERAHEEAIAENQLFDREQEIAAREAEAQRVIEEAERKQREAQERIERMEREEREAREAAERAEREERERIERMEREERERIEREERRERERLEREQRIAREAAERAERELLESQEAERKKAERRAKRKAHVAKVDKDIMDCLVVEVFDKEVAGKLLSSLKAGAIDHVTINY
jgi:DNA repair exonuclease SbcCD ATPase subunit